MTRACQKFSVFVTPHFFSAFFDDAAQNYTSEIFLLKCGFHRPSLKSISRFNSTVDFFLSIMNKNFFGKDFFIARSLLDKKEEKSILSPFSKREVSLQPF